MSSSECGENMSVPIECDEVFDESAIQGGSSPRIRRSGDRNLREQPHKGRKVQPASTSRVSKFKKRPAILPNKNKAAYLRGRHFMAVVPIDKEESVIQTLNEKSTYYVGQQEKGNEGSIHFQVTFGFAYQKTLSAVTKMLQLRSIEIVRDLRAAIMYCTKIEGRVGDIVEYGDIPNTEYAGHNRLLLTACEKETYEEAMAFLEDADLMFFLSHKKTIGPWLSAKFKQDIDVPLYDISKFNRSAFTDFSKTLVLIGPTGVGKTQFALAHFKNPLLIRDKNDYIRYSRHTDGIIFDDLSFTSWNPMTFLHMVENETPITQDVKFGHVRIRANIPKFILVNSEELLWPRDIIRETKDACLRRMVIYYIQTPLFTKTVSTFFCIVFHLSID